MRSMAALRAAGPSAREAAGAAAPTCGLAALSSLCLVARLHHVSAEPEALRHQLGLGSSDSLTVSHLLLAGQRIGLKVKHSRSTAERLPLLPLPALALLGDGRVVVLAQCDTQRVLMLDPAAGGAQQPRIP
jgi:subfamily B ATP-binding cassette protein HlyB/CyaB